MDSITPCLSQLAEAATPSSAATHCIGELKAGPGAEIVPKKDLESHPASDVQDETGAECTTSVACGEKAVDREASVVVRHVEPNGLGQQARTQADREEFTGLLISNRKVDSERWVHEIRGMKRVVVPFSRLSDLKIVSRVQQDRDRVMIGVLYDRPRAEKFANGEQYLCWGLTDLAQPQPRRVNLHIRWRAYEFWKKSIDNTRGSIFALMNPVLVTEGNPSGDSLPVVRVEKQHQLAKLGDCPALGFCRMKACQQPVNSEIGDRYCMVHLNQAYAQKPGRVAAGGGVFLRGLVGVETRGSKPAHRQFKNVELEEEEPANQPSSGADAIAERRKVALKLDDRRFANAEVNENYVKAIQRGTRAEDQAWSKVPVLGRGLEDSSDLTIDMDTVESSERKQAERIMGQRVERMEQMVAKRHLQAETDATLEDGTLRACSMEALSSVVAPKPPTRKKAKTERQEEIRSTTPMASDKRPTPATKPMRSLGELVQQIKHGSKAPRRASSKTGVSGSGSSSQQIGRSVPQHSAQLTTSAEERCESLRHAEPDAAERTSAEPDEAEPDAEPDADGVLASPIVSSNIDQNNARVEDGDRAPPPRMESETGKIDLFLDKTIAEEICTDAGDKALAAQVQNLTDELVSAGQDRDRIRAVFDAADALPAKVWKEDTGKRLQAEVGKLVLKGPEDLKKTALAARRRWRQTSSVAHVSASHAETVIASAAGDGGA